MSDSGRPYRPKIRAYTNEKGITGSGSVSSFWGSLGRPTGRVKRCGDRSFTAAPKRHLAPVCPIEYVTLDSWGRLIGLRNPVSWMFHELRKVVHGCELVSHSSR